MAVHFHSTEHKASSVSVLTAVKRTLWKGHKGDLHEHLPSCHLLQWFPWLLQLIQLCLDMGSLLWRRILHDQLAMSYHKVQLDLLIWKLSQQSLKCKALELLLGILGKVEAMSDWWPRSVQDYAGFVGTSCNISRGKKYAVDASKEPT